MEGAEGGPAGLEMLEGCHDIGLSNFDTLRNHKIPDFLLGGKYKGCVFRTTASELIYFLTTAGGMGGGGTAWALQRRRVCQRSVGDEGEKRRYFILPLH